jgi:hypothetical protein
LTAQAVRRTATSILLIAGSKDHLWNRAACRMSRLKNRLRSMAETRLKSPKICFSADSYLVYGIRRDSRLTKIGGESVARVRAKSAWDGWSDPSAEAAQRAGGSDTHRLTLHDGYRKGSTHPTGCGLGYRFFRAHERIAWIAQQRLPI